MAPGGRAGLGVLSCSVSRQGFRMGEGAWAIQEVEGKLIRLGRASKPQITHFIQPKVEETVHAFGDQVIKGTAAPPFSLWISGSSGSLLPRVRI